MKKPAIAFAWFTLSLFGPLGSAAPQEGKPPAYPAMQPLEQYLPASPQEEIAMARSAAPSSVSADATVLVLGKHGYETAAKGKNGWVCFVMRSWMAAFDDDVVFWDPKIRGPNCFNPPAVRSVLPQYVQRTDWVLAGAGRPEMLDKAKAAYAAHRFRAPETGSFAFMLSKQGVLGGGDAWYPHVMFFVAHGQTADWASGLENSPIMGSEFGPYEPTTLYIPVPRWSDGSPAPVPGNDHQHSE